MSNLVEWLMEAVYGDKIVVRLHLYPEGSFPYAAEIIVFTQYVEVETYNGAILHYRVAHTGKILDLELQHLPTDINHWDEKLVELTESWSENWRQAERVVCTRGIGTDVIPASHPAAFYHLARLEGMAHEVSPHEHPMRQPFYNNAARRLGGLLKEALASWTQVLG